jgi:hypothetical protein
MLGERVTSLNKSLQAGAKRLERKQVKEDDFPSAPETAIGALDRPICASLFSIT